MKVQEQKNPLIQIFLFPLVRIKKKLARLGILFGKFPKTNKASLRENVELK